MAFDFLNYIVDQTQQNTRLFIEKPKEQRKYIISHIVALQLIYLRDLDPNKAYQLLEITTPQGNEIPLPNDILKSFEENLSSNAEQIEQAYEQINQLLLTELKQLNESAQLGAFGIKELTDGQLPWVQNNVDDWFWDTLQQTEHKITKTHKNNEPNFNQMMRDFNQIILKNETATDETLDLEPTELTPYMTQTPRIATIFQPIIALVILYFLYNAIL